jgi:hypothetical protein
MEFTAMAEAIKQIEKSNIVHRKLAQRAFR